MKLSDRLEAVAAMVSEGNILADIGTDHGYIPIKLVKEGKIPSAIAMDLRRGPLKRAGDNIAAEGLSESIETRLSDGMDGLKSGEADSVLIAGMGGELIKDILKRGESIRESVSEYVISPHSEWRNVRKYLCENGYKIQSENMVLDEGKFYTVIRAENGNEDKEYSEYELLFGRLLIKSGHTILKEYLKRERAKTSDILKGLNESKASLKTAERKSELKKYLEYIEEAENEMR